MSHHHQHADKVPRSVKIQAGLAASIVATTLVHPLDVVKVRTQLATRRVFARHMVIRILEHEGIKAFYRGLTAGWFRQITYTSTRLAVYNFLHDDYVKSHNQKPDLSKKVNMGIISGLAGAFAGTPSEMVLVRMIADGPIDPCSRNVLRHRKYKGTLHTILRISKEEGVRSLWRGTVPTLGRSVFVSIVQIASYEQTKELLNTGAMVDGPLLHIYTSIISSFLTAFVSLPADSVKTQYQAKRSGLSQPEILSYMLKKKGILYLWKGLVPYFIRMAVHTMTTVTMLDEFTDYYYKHFYSKNNKI